MTLHLSRRLFAITLSVLTANAMAQSPANPPTSPTVIRIGSPELGVGKTGFPGATSLAIAKQNQWIEQEFAKDGVKVEWTLFRGAGPAVNEALAAGQLDVVFLGDLAGVIGKSRGLPTRLIAVTGRNSNSYLAVAPGAGIKTFADLKGRKVAVLKGTAYQRPFDALLADAGLTEKDIRAVNMDWPTSKAAVVGKDVDATFGGADLHLLLDKGVTLPVSTKGRGPAYGIYSAILATDDFIRKYPAATTRLLKPVLRAAAWASEDANRTATFTLWGEQSGQGPTVFAAEYEGENLKQRHSPLLDEAAITAYKGVTADALKLGLIKQNLDVDAWVAPQFVEAAARELKLEKFWPRQDRNGKALP